MKKCILCLITVLILLTSCAAEYGTSGEFIKEFPRTKSIKVVEDEDTEVKAVWISYLDYGKTLSGLTEDAFKIKIDEMFSEISDFGFNTVIFQVRSHSDALYESDYYPASASVSGTLGGTLSFDPLEIAVLKAHEKGLKIEAWINPLRAHTDEESALLSDDLTFKQWYNDPEKKGKNIVLYGGRWYFNPAVEEVRTLIAEGAREICSNYDVDGIHIDDYFYPTTDESFDKAVFEESGNSLTLEEFRKNAVSEMVKGMYSAIKEEKDYVLFGISPQGNISNCVRKCYADVYRWCSEEGFADYIAPQIYYSFKQSYLPFDKALAEWQDIGLRSGLRFYIGLAGYKVAGRYTYSTEEERLDWLQNRDMLSRQVSLGREAERYNGFIVFSYGSLFIDNDVETDKEKENLKKLL